LAHRRKQTSSIHIEHARKYIETYLPHKDPTPLSSIFPSAPPSLLDLLAHMLIFDPNRRITVEDALEHPYLANLHDSEDEPICPRVFNLFDFEEQVQVDSNNLRNLIWEEVLGYHPELRQPAQ
jgi:serine/threonine protein kinase